MSRQQSQAAIHKALSLSHELVRIARSGDAEQAQTVNSQRACLIREFLDGAEPVVAEDLHTLAQISGLNREAIEILEARQRGTLKEFETVSRGRQALRAYGATRSRIS